MPTFAAVRGPWYECMQEMIHVVEASIKSLEKKDLPDLVLMCTVLGDSPFHQETLDKVGHLPAQLGATGRLKALVLHLQ